MKKVLLYYSRKGGLAEQQGHWFLGKPVFQLSPLLETTFVTAYQQAWPNTSAETMEKMRLQFHEGTNNYRRQNGSKLLKVHFYILH